MCGIFGFWSKDDRPISVKVLERATTAIRHRGPDDEGYLLVETRGGSVTLCAGRDTSQELALPPVEQFSGGSYDLGLGFRRLSILDISSAGHQPMKSEDGRCWIIFNGEIYNYLELRAELADKGHKFHTGTDTEVVLAAYRHWGEDCLSHFVGMWAFAIWDAEKRRLFLARDPFGIKPLYYVSDARQFVFASEIKALLESGRVSREVNASRLHDYLTIGLTDYGEETMFAGVRQIPPAHSLTVALDDPNSVRLKRYWQIDLDRKLQIPFEEAARRLRELFMESVKLHLRSDVPVGTALSGGIDSSSISMAVRSLEPEADLRTFSYIADDEAVNEERWVDMVVAASSANVHKVHPTPAELTSDLDRLIGIQDEPFGSTSIYAQHRVFRRARESGVTVMLDGQGADEMLAGYLPYLVARLASLLRQGRLLKAGKFASQASDILSTRKRRLLAGSGGLLLPSLVGQSDFAVRFRRLTRMAGLSNATHLDWLNKDWFDERAAGRRKPSDGHSRDILRRTLHETLTETSLPMLLRYEDRNSMAHSIESRVPFLTTALAEFIFALPEEHLIGPDGTSKLVFRRAMRGLVPDAILNRRDKIGFATPERRWLTQLHPWVDGVLQSDAAHRIQALNLPVMKAEWESILSGQSAFDWRVWRWLNLIRWGEQFEINF